MDRLTEDVGGFNNATTRDDVDGLLRSRAVELPRDAAVGGRRAARVADRRRRELQVGARRGEGGVSLPRARAAVRPLLLRDRQRLVRRASVQAPGIGSIEDLDAATLADVQAFHATFYRPDNAVLVVVGDFDRSSSTPGSTSTSASIPNPATPIPRVTVKEPPRKRTKRFDGARPERAAAGRRRSTWLLPDARSADSAPLTVAAAILGLGESSRAVPVARLRQKIAKEIEIDADLREDGGLFIALRDHGERSQDRARARKRCATEIDALAAKPVDRAELEKAKNQLIATVAPRARDEQRQGGRHRQRVVVEHDAAAVNKDIDKLAGGDAGGRAARREEIPDRRKADRDRLHESKAGRRMRSEDRAADHRFRAPARALRVRGRSRPRRRRPAPPRAANIPTPTEKTLANGLRVIVDPEAGRAARRGAAAGQDRRRSRSGGSGRPRRHDRIAADEGDEDQVGRGDRARRGSPRRDDRERRRMGQLVRRDQLSLEPIRRGDDLSSPTSSAIRRSRRTRSSGCASRTSMR